MRHNKILTRPAKVGHITFDELYDEISHDWQEKAARLQARRWHVINKELKRNEPRQKRLEHLRLSPR